MVLAVTTPFPHDWVTAHATATPEAPAIASIAARLTYGDLARRVDALAGRLHESGVGPGARVVVALPNSPAMIVASLAVQRLGGIPVEVNRDLRPEVLAGVVGRMAARHLVITTRDRPKWEAILAEGPPMDRIWVVPTRGTDPSVPATIGGAATGTLLEDGHLGPGAMDPAEATDPSTAEATHPAGVSDDPTSDALILYTSGSTGVPHAVAQTYANIDANTRSIVEYLGLTQADRALLTLPLHYCYGRSVLQTHLFAGGSVYLDDRFAFPRIVIEAMAAEACTGFAGVPLTFEILRRQVDVAAMAFPTLRYVTQAGGAMHPETIDWAREAFAPAELYVMYGQTEATARLSYLPPSRASDKTGSIGIAIPGVTLDVVDETARPVPRGSVGQLVARGANVTSGYVGEPEASADILHDGWLWTGDLASQDDDGFFYLRGRSKEILKIGGHRISPGEIEGVLIAHPGVADAAVAGIPDDLLGEVPKAFVIREPFNDVTAEALRSYCREHLPAYATPVDIAFVDAFPRNAAGKVLRAELTSRPEGAQGDITG